jgi:hypothetical protein
MLKHRKQLLFDIIHIKPSADIGWYLPVVQSNRLPAALTSSFQIFGNRSANFSLILSLTLLQTIWVHRGYV